MSFWVITAIAGYFLLAIKGVVDKFLLSGAVKSPIVYVFYSGVMAPLIFVLAPFGLDLLPWPLMLLAFVSGGCFVAALYFLFSAMQQTSISRVLPIEGGLVPIFTLVLAALFLAEKLTSNQLISFGLLVLGAVIISFRHDRSGWHPPALRDATIAAFFFASSFVIEKYIYGYTNFVSGIVWTRVGVFIFVMTLLLFRKNRQIIFATPHKTGNSSAVLFYSAQILAAVGAMLQHYSISLGSVTIVNALQGTQFVFLLTMTAILSRGFPSILKEKFTTAIVLQKLLAISIITLGLVSL